jgi:acetoin utilization deacetylase AcuC-like enzyme
MQVFGVIYDRLLRQGVVLESHVHVPPKLPSDSELALVHTPEYLEAFSTLQLDKDRVRR